MMCCTSTTKVWLRLLVYLKFQKYIPFWCFASNRKERHNYEGGGGGGEEEEEEEEGEREGGGGSKL